MPSSTLSPEKAVLDSKLTTRFAQMQNSEYQRELEQTWTVIEEVKDVIQRNVSQENIRPIDAARTIAAVTGSLFGYEEFHRTSDNPMVADLYSSLNRR